MKKLLIVICLFFLMGAMLIGCSCEDGTADHVHEWSGGAILRHSSKTQYGIIEYTCNICGEKLRQTMPKIDHDHDFTDDWKNDRMAHWHTCSVQNCTIIDSNEPHKWDSGVIVEEANQTGSGTKKYTCTVCGYSRAESYVSAPKVTNKGWVDAFERTMFENVTVVYTSSAGEESKLEVKVAKGQVYYKDASGKETVRADGLSVPFGSYGLAQRFAFMQSEFNNVTYDTATRAYLFEKNGVKGSVQFSDGKITAFSIVKDGTTEKYTLSAYGRTEISE